MKHTWLFAVLWNIVAIPTGVVAWQQGIRGSDPRALIGFLFPLIGVWLLGWAAYQTALWRIFGASVLQLATVPGVVGGPLRATLEASRRLAGASGATLTRAVRLGSDADHRHVSDHDHPHDDRATDGPDAVLRP